MEKRELRDQQKNKITRTIEGKKYRNNTREILRHINNMRFKREMARELIDRGISTEAVQRLLTIKDNDDFGM